MSIFTTSYSRILHALATNGQLTANSFVDQRRLEIASRVVRNLRSYTLESWPQTQSAYQAVLASQQSLFADALLSRLISCRATPDLAQQIINSELLTRHVGHQQNHLYDGLIVHIDADLDQVSVGTQEEAAAHAFPSDPASIRDLAAALLANQMPKAA